MPTYTHTAASGLHWICSKEWSLRPDLLLSDSGSQDLAAPVASPPPNENCVVIPVASLSSSPGQGF